jgi:PIN domain nuclease of toxin-antitoxin system
MEVLLDTHTFLWFVGGADELSAQARAVIENPNNRKYISLASFWEIAIKQSIGKLTLTIPLSALKDKAEKDNFQILPVCFEDILQLTELPFHHRDPFDRIILSQALHNNLTLLSRDGNFSCYDVRLIW